MGIQFQRNRIELFCAVLYVYYYLSNTIKPLIDQLSWRMDGFLEFHFVKMSNKANQVWG